MFDTAYHQTMPAHAFTYGLPYEMMTQHLIRRYGFHGTSHKYLAQEAARQLGKPLEQLNAITCHLGAPLPSHRIALPGSRLPPRGGGGGGPSWCRGKARVLWAAHGGGGSGREGAGGVGGTAAPAHWPQPWVVPAAAAP